MYVNQSLRVRRDCYNVYICGFTYVRISSNIFIERRYTVTKNTITNVVEDTSIVLGTVIGIEQIETILGIVILAIQFFLIVFKGTRRIIQAIKDKKLEEAEKHAEEMIHDLDSIKGSNETKYE